MKKCLNISDEKLLEKLEYFIYEYSELQQDNESESRENHVNDNKADHRHQLREKLLYHYNSQGYSEKELSTIIELFLEFLCTDDIYDMEASMSLDALLDAVWESGSDARNWKCVKRLNSILASVYGLYFVSKAQLFDEKTTETNMKTIFKKNIAFYTREDKKFLMRVFFEKRQYDCFFDLVKSYEKSQDKIVFDDIRECFEIFNEFKKSMTYSDGMDFYDQSREFLGKVENSYIRGFWRRLGAEILFYLRKYEEAIEIYEDDIAEYSGKKDLAEFFMLFNMSVCYAWAANYKEKDSEDWSEYIEKAIAKLTDAESCIDSGKNAEYSSAVVLEKAFLLSEKGDHKRAFEYLKRGFSSANEKIKKMFTTDSYLWILMKYMELDNADKYKEIREMIANLRQVFSCEKLKEYGGIINFIESDEYLKTDSEMNLKIYKYLLELLFYALEIRHEAKVRDVSKYDILYYTKAEHLKLLLNDEEAEKCHYRLPMFHVYHMNDPQEGKILNQLLKNDKLASVHEEESTDKRKTYEENYVFLKSFFCYSKEAKVSAKEFLPMWVQYGNDAEGCCVILNGKTFENSYLRRIIYLTDEGTCADDKNIDKLLMKFREKHKDLVSFCNKNIDRKSSLGKECMDQIGSLLTYIVSQISYLFKHESYKHENEVRLIINRTSTNLDDVQVISGDIPKIYIYNDRQTYIDEVILGPKMSNPEDYVSFIYKQGIKMWKDEKKQIKVTQSTIQYR